MSGVRRRRGGEDWPDLCYRVAKRLIGLGVGYSGLGGNGIGQVVSFEDLAELPADKIRVLIAAIEAEHEKRPALRGGGFDLKGLRLLAGEPVLLPSWLIGAELEGMPWAPINHYRLSHEGLELVDLTFG